MTAFLSNAVLWPVLLPFLTAALTACLWERRRAQRLASSVGALAMFAASLLLLSMVVRDGVQAVQFGAWAAPFGITFAADRFGAIMTAVAGLMACAALLFGMADIRRREERAGFHPLLHGMLAGVNGAFLTGDIFNLYVWFEIMLITAMGLLVIGRTRAQLDGVFRYAVLNLFSTLLFLLAVALLYGVTGTLNMADLGRVVPTLEPSPTLTISALLLLSGFAIKAGFFPLFFWLPASYHTASIPVSAIFAALLTKAGIYASFRVFTLIFPETPGLREVAAVMAAGGMLFGVFGAAVQWDIRRILAFHSVSQFGYMVLALALGTQAAFAGAIIYIVHHSLVKANLFLIAGAVHRASGSFDLRAGGGLMRQNPLLAALFVISGLSLAGIPPLSGFWAKFMVIDASLKAEGWWLAGTGLFVGLLTLYSMTKIWMEAFWKEPAGARKKTRPVPVPMLASIFAVSVLIVAMGIFAEPVVAFAGAASAQLLDPAPYIQAVLGERAP